MNNISKSNKSNQTFQLKDGRQMGYAEFGDPNGKPVFFFHTTPGARLFPHFDESIATALTTRIITIERPGYGLSDFQPDNTLVNWTQDVVQFADFLNIEQFVVAGVSGGGPYALACASEIPERIIRVGVISSLSPLNVSHFTEGTNAINRVLIGIAHYTPFLLKPLLSPIALIGRKNPQKLFDYGLRNYFPVHDQKVLFRPAVRDMFLEHLPQAFHQGARGFALDMNIFAESWGFQLKNISPKVYLWHGEKDENVTLSAGRYLANTIPNCEARFYPDEGHLLIFDHWQKILTTLVS
ncbi:alpha/beta fold hydrolase [Calothrix sp. CCY 0018]|uniref:alpha/beta fold hydrolase n=1 Tax=Calothrix sp. CCY 0018 TaxID=3103864 RepID=UPI0039C63C47